MADDQNRADPNERPENVRLDATAVRVLAHPMRSLLLSRLRGEGPATATELAEALDTNTGATSYHLRKLAEVGLVTDTGEGEGRRRQWRAASRSHSFTGGDYPADEQTQAAVAWLGRHYLRQAADGHERYLDREEDWPQDWRDALSVNDDAVVVEPEQLRAMHAELDEVVARYRSASDTPRARRVRVNLIFSPADPRWS
ncbi:ArsR/SmtB family transcription factor [Enemella evansiae]|uniref:ArsR/SmtB family transcription factor n=1 Tax=Enemella evansiae TaxID=2016499 RepID=UPI00105D5592|nr:helix-turn-helix domain-containing protein [Enemella evansiae]TDO87735.1 ArsR family transcriptional regulator [Enemella evansiae]